MAAEGDVRITSGSGCASRAHRAHHCLRKKIGGTECVYASVRSAEKALHSSPKQKQNKNIELARPKNSAPQARLRRARQGSELEHPTPAPAYVWSRRPFRHQRKGQSTCHDWAPGSALFQTSLISCSGIYYFKRHGSQTSLFHTISNFISNMP